MSGDGDGGLSGLMGTETGSDKGPREGLATPCAQAAGTVDRCGRADLARVAGRSRATSPTGAVNLALLCAAVFGIPLGGSGTAVAQVTTVWSATLTAGKDVFGGSVWGWRSIDVAMNGDDRRTWG